MKTYRFRGPTARRLREERGLTVREVAAAVGIADGTLTNLERGHQEPSAPVYIRICQALDVDPALLREAREEAPPRKKRRGSGGAEAA
ncbi:helix-turn-helix transcriptional regulator [Nocardiopsis sp. CNT-189]|uniref:helix-turn-helix domain-containing protein n=1 Tax=Nocardiopsis oceanisediminis TaxID=2816862 RepID=UPI003B3085B3